MIVAASWVVVFLAYGLMAAFVGVHLYEQWERRDRRTATSPANAAAWGGLFWPVGLWVAVAVAWIEGRERDRKRAEAARLERERLYELARPDLERLGIAIPRRGGPA